MTTFQDPQPQSRRAVRQSERSETEPQPGFTESAAPAAVPQFYSDPAAPSEMWDTTARRAAQLPPVAPANSGRRAAELPAQPAPVAEPLTYSTQQRPVVPVSDAPSFRSRAAAAPEQPLPPTQAIPQAEQPSYRVRDFSPEGRRAAPASEPAWTAPANHAPAPPASDLQYHTEARVTQLPVAQVPPTLAPTPVAPPVVVPVPAVDQMPEQTMSRRELRAHQQPEVEQPQVEQPQFTQPAAYTAQPAAPQQVAPVPEAPVAQAPVSQAPIEQPPVAQAPVAPAFMQPAPVQEAPFQQPPVEPAPVQQQAAPAPELSPFDALFQPQAAEPVAPEPVAPFQQAAPVLPPVAPEPQANTGLTRAINEFDALTRAPEEAPAPQAAAPTYAVQPPAVQPEPQETGVWTPPVGHWTTQAGQEDEFPESTVNRTIGSGSTATNALVIPIPLGNDIRGPLTSTGEIMLTGSIDLPRNLATTGQSDRFDHDGIDALFDLSDHEVVATDSAPVRAVTAVSTHSSGHGVTHTQKPKGNKALTALLIAASSMAVVVAGLLIAAFAFNIF